MSFESRMLEPAPSQVEYPVLKEVDVSLPPGTFGTKGNLPIFLKLAVIDESGQERLTIKTIRGTKVVGYGRFDDDENLLLHARHEDLDILMRLAIKYLIRYELDGMDGAMRLLSEALAWISC